MSRYFKGLVTAACVLVLATGSQAQDKKDSKQDPEQQADVRTLMTAVDDLMGGKTAEGTLPLKWQQEHFIKALAGRTYVPFTLTIDPAAFTATTPVALYLRVAKRGQTAAAPTA